MNKRIYVVDMLKGFAKEGALKSKEVDNIIPNIKAFLKYNKNESIVFVNDVHSEDDLEMKQYPLHCLKNSNEAEIVDELKEFAKEIIYKDTTNAFFYIDLKDLEKYDEFIIIGCCTDICIMQFALSLKIYLNKVKIEKNVRVLTNCVATFDSSEHNGQYYNDFALKIMQNAGIKIE